MQVARSEHTGGVWPPVGVEVIDAFHLPFLNTMILLLSGCTVTWAHHALIHGDRQGLLQGLALTVLLGALFTSIQAYEYRHAAFVFADGIYSWTLYMAPGFPVIHVLVHPISLILCCFRALPCHSHPNHHFASAARH